MSKQISQETFNDVVKENIETFEMELQEAISDAKKQFEAQGVNLYNIIFDEDLFRILDGEIIIEKHPIITHSEILNEKVSNEDILHKDIEQSLTVISEYFNKDLSYRLIGAKAGITNIICKILKRCIEYKDSKILITTLNSSITYFVGQPDEVTEDIIMSLLDVIKNDEFDHKHKALAFKTLSVSCQKNEKNRSLVVNEPYKIIHSMVDVLEKSEVRHRELIKEICSFCRVLILDDDVRVTCGSGTEYAKSFVLETSGLDTLLNLCKTYTEQEDELIVSEIFATLDKLSVRNEFCQRILDMGGLNHIFETVENHQNTSKIVVASFGLLKSLAANDKVKFEIGRHPNGLYIILKALENNVRNEKVCINGCGALAAIVLKQTDNAKIMMSIGLPSLLGEILKVHTPTEHHAVLRPACLTIRNIVSRCPEFVDTFLKLDFETLLNDILKLGRNCDDEAKAALRDLGCFVVLQERWTGKNQGVQND